MSGIDLSESPEKVLLVGVALKSERSDLMESNLEELAQLAESAGAVVVGLVRQRLDRIVPATYLGAGKIKEIAILKDETQAQTVIIDAKLSGVQGRNLKEIIGCKILDRSQIILDIFAQRARSSEGKLQVELAQLQDQLPRLIGEAIAGLSRLGGGIGTRGPGETKLEMDRRRVHKRLALLKNQLEHVRQSRLLHRNRRRSTQTPTISLVGYTNAGKSTLFNKLTKSDVFAADQLFATLDPTSRQLLLPSGKKTVITDTVGFINKLPTHLVDAFKATLEEITESDLILHVHDLSHSNFQIQSEVVTNLLLELNADMKKVVHVYNKSDLLKGPLPSREFPSVVVSSLTGEGIDGLLAFIDKTLSERADMVDLYIPTSMPKLMLDLARDGKIISTDIGAHVTHVKVDLTQDALQRWSRYLEK